MTTVRRFLLGFVAVAVLAWLLWPAQEPQRVVREAAIPRAVLRAPTVVPPPRAPTASVVQSEAVRPPAISRPVYGKADFFQSMAREYGDEGIAFEATATVDYPGYEGKFTFDAVVSSARFEGTPGIAILLVDALDPSMQVGGAGSLEGNDADALAEVRLPFNFVSPFFRMKSEEETRQVRPVGQMTLAVFTLDRDKRRGTVPLEAFFDYQTTGPMTPVGTVRYAPKRKAIPPG